MQFLFKCIAFITTFLICHISYKSFSQSPEILSDTVFKYFIGNSNPDISWKNIDFDDSSWNTAYFSVGYGDNDDSTLIDTTTSVYARCPFYITDIESISELIMLLDFDDGFVAYINGIEFARVNLGKHGSETSYDQLADRSHEAEAYRRDRSSVYGYYVDDTIISKHIKVGVNYLSVEVHNDSIKGSDLTLNASLVNLNGYYNMYDAYSRYKRSVELDSTLLPIIIIETDEFGVPFKRIERPGTIAVIDNDGGKYNKPTDSISGHSGLIEIELRGESSALFPKKSYDFETQDADGNDTSIALCGLPKENDWVLQGPFADKSQIRNALIYELGRKTGRWHPRVKFVEVIFNGEYIGLYNLIEKIKRDSARVRVKKLKEDEITGNDLTGGYIIKYDKGTSNLQIVYPNKKDIMQEQIDYINNYFDEFNNVLYSNKGLDEIAGYSRFVDKPSFIDYTVIAEFAKNCDSYLFSSYMYKDRSDINSRIQFGPLWDFDLCFGNAHWQEGSIINKWQFEFRANNRFHHERLFEDPKLVDMFENRWFELREKFLHTDSLNKLIDDWVDTLDGSIKRNYQVWPLINKPLFVNVYGVNNYSEEIEHIKQWIDERTTWIDENISAIYYPVTDFPSNMHDLYSRSIVSEIYPNPFSDNFTIKLKLDSDMEISANLLTMDGKKIDIIPLTSVQPGEFILHWNEGAILCNGVYILEIRINNEVREQYKVVKLTR
jgi:hypothetical protein